MLVMKRMKIVIWIFFIDKGNLKGLFEYYSLIDELESTFKSMLI